MGRRVDRPLKVFVASAADLLTDHAIFGEGLIAWNLFSALARRGHDLVVCARRAELRDDPPFELVVTGRASRWESIEPLAYARRARVLYERMGGAKRFDAVHWLFPQGTPPMAPPTATSFVIGPHSLSWDVGKARRRARAGDIVRMALSPVERAVRREAFARATSILVSTPPALEDVPSVVRRRADVLPFGIDSARFAVAELPRTPVVAFVGSLDRRKGVHDLIEAFIAVAASLPAHLIVAGDGPERSAVEAKVAASGLESRVELRGHVPNCDVPALLSEASVVCLPSHGEPFGMTVLEAMASGRAVVSTDEGGPRFLIDDSRGGRLVPRESPAALARVMLELLGDQQLLAAMGAFNRQRVEDEFELDLIANRMEVLYRGASRNRATDLRLTQVLA